MKAFNMEWMKVEDRLPEKGKEVLVWSDRYGRTFATYVDENKFGTMWLFNGEPILTFNAPTHWMPLPSPPKQ